MTLFVMLVLVPRERFSNEVMGEVKVAFFPDLAPGTVGNGSR